MNPEQEKMLAENNALLKQINAKLDKYIEEYETFKKTTGFDPSDEGGCPTL